MLETSTREQTQKSKTSSQHATFRREPGARTRRLCFAHLFPVANSRGYPSLIWCSCSNYEPVAAESPPRQNENADTCTPSTPRYRISNTSTLRRNCDAARTQWIPRTTATDNHTPHGKCLLLMNLMCFTLSNRRSSGGLGLKSWIQEATATNCRPSSMR